MSLYLNESLLTIILETEYENLAAAEVTKILYKKHGGTEGSWNATVQGTTLFYALQPGDIDVVGEWTFQAYIEIGGLPHYGTTVTKQVKRPITVT
jgi:hypothetical protein